MEREAVEEVAGPLLNPLGVDGAPLMAVGEWLLPFITARREGDEKSEQADVSWHHGDKAGMREPAHPAGYHRSGSTCQALGCCCIPAATSWTGLWCRERLWGGMACSACLSAARA